MYSDPLFWLIALGCLAAGAAAGWFLRRAVDPAQQKLRELERLLADSDAALHAYRREVTEHFRGTAERVNRLTEDYRELHAHLAEGAIGLCEPAGEPAPLLTSLGGSGYPQRGGLPPSTQPPLDYAPARGERSSVAGADLDDLDRIQGA